MIRLTRVRTSAAIPASFRGTSRVARELLLLQEEQRAPAAFQEAFWRAHRYWGDAKDQLKIESREKCAYC